MAILSVNAGSSSLKFSLYPFVEKEVQAQILTGSIEGLEPGGAPLMSWSYQGQSAHKALATNAERPFD